MVRFLDQGDHVVTTNRGGQVTGRAFTKGPRVARLGNRPINVAGGA